MPMQYMYGHVNLYMCMGMCTCVLSGTHYVWTCGGHVGVPVYAWKLTHACAHTQTYAGVWLHVCTGRYGYIHGLGICICGSSTCMCLGCYTPAVLPLCVHVCVSSHVGLGV